MICRATPFSLNCVFFVLLVCVGCQFDASPSVAGAGPEAGDGRDVSEIERGGRGGEAAGAGSSENVAANGDAGTNAVVGTGRGSPGGSASTAGAGAGAGSAAGTAVAAAGTVAVSTAGTSPTGNGTGAAGSGGASAGSNAGTAAAAATSAGAAGVSQAGASGTSAAGAGAGVTGTAGTASETDITFPELIDRLSGTLSEEQQTRFLAAFASGTITPELMDELISAVQAENACEGAHAQCQAMCTQVLERCGSCMVNALRRAMLAAQCLAL